MFNVFTALKLLLSLFLPMEMFKWMGRRVEIQTGLLKRKTVNLRDERISQLNILENL